jgi:membrane-bound ClpP family serine protease
LRPAGTARFDNQLVDVFAEGTYVATGATVRVVEISGNRVIVSEVV